MPVDAVLRTLTTRSATYRREQNLEDRRGLGIVGALHLGWRGLTTAERAANARRQLRDRFGRFVEMGGPVVFEHGTERGAGTFEGLNPEGDAIVRDRSTLKLRFVPVDSLRTVMARARIGGDTAREEDILDLDDPDYLPKVIARLDRLGVTDNDFDLSSAPRGAGYKEMGYEPKTPSPEDIDTYNSLIRNYYNQYLRERGRRGLEDEPELTKEEFASELAALAASRYQGNMVVAAPIGKLAAILLDGSVRSQFETGSSRGFNSPSTRRILEEEILGIPPDLPDRLRPIYGSLEEDVDSRVTGDNYGELALTLKLEVRDRSTATGADTLDHRPTIGVPLSDIGVSENGVEKVTDEQYVLSASESILDQFTEQLVDPEDYDDSEGYALYTELQIHGGLPLSDVANIGVDEWSIKYNERQSVDDLIAEDNYQDALEEILRVFGFEGQNLMQVPGLEKIFDEAVADMAAGANPYNAAQEAINAIAAALGQPLDLTIY